MAEQLSRGRTRVFVVVFAVGLCAATLVATHLVGPARATSGAGGDPYAVPQAVDTNASPTILETTIFSDETPGVDIGNGVTANVQTFNGTIPGPELRLNVGDTLIVHYENRLDRPSGIHWHGMELDNASDGTPLTQNMVPPGGKFLYKFKLHRAGVYWYHPHHHSSMNQVFKGLYGSLIVSDPGETALRAANVLPPQANTRTLVLSDMTVCRAGPDDTVTYPPTSPHVSGVSPLQSQPGLRPSDLCDTPVNDDGAPIGTPLGEGDVPNIQRTSGNTNEGRIVLTNGKNVGGRAGDQNTPGALGPAAVTQPVAPGSGQRFQLVNAATTRYFRLRLTSATGSLIPLVRVGGEGGLLDNAVLDGGHAPYELKYDQGEILLAPGERADVVASIPTNATGVATLWEEDFRRTGSSTGYANLPTVPVAHLNITGPAASPAYGISAGTQVLTHPAIDRQVETLPTPTGGFITPAGGFVAPKLGMTLPRIELAVGGNGTDTFINDVKGMHDSPGDYTAAPTVGSTRYAARVGDTLELTVLNTTNTHHPFHPHGFSIQPLTLERPLGLVVYSFPREFVDEVDIPPGATLRYRVRLDDRPLMDGVTMGGATGRWVMHCHMFFHAMFGMTSEIIVTDLSGNERPYVNSAGVETPVVSPGGAVSMTGTYFDVERDAVTLAASVGTVTNNGNGTWTWNHTANAAQLVYITITDAGGKKDQIAFDLRVSGTPATSTSSTTSTSSPSTTTPSTTTPSTTTSTPSTTTTTTRPPTTTTSTSTSSTTTTKPSTTTTTTPATTTTTTRPPTTTTPSTTTTTRPPTTTTPPAGPLCNSRAATIVGTPAADRIVATPGPDVIVGLGGADRIYGYGDDDVICGGDGNDLIYGGLGNDFVDGGAGADTVQGEAGNDGVGGGDGADKVFGGDGDDQVNGGAAKDYCYGGTGANIFIACEVFPTGTT